MSRALANDHLSEYPLEEMERGLMPRLDPKSRTPHNMSLRFDVLNSQDGCRRFYSIIDIAVVFKRTLARLESIDDQVQHFDDELLRMQINQILTESCHTLKERLYRKNPDAETHRRDVWQILARARKKWSTRFLCSTTGLSVPTLSS